MKKRKKKNILDPKTPVESLKLPTELSLTGMLKEKYIPLELKVDIDDSFLPIFSLSPVNKSQEETSVTVESPPPLKKRIWKDKLNSSEINTLTMKSLKILDQASTLKEKDLTPFWNQQSKELSEMLWSPIKIDYVVSVLNSSQDSSRNHPEMGKSWFSINKKLPQKKNSLMTSFQSSQFSHLGSMVSGVTPSENTSTNLKTLKIRIFPTQEERTKIHLTTNQYKWYFNASIDIFYDHYKSGNILKKDSYSNTVFRDVIRTYKYVEEEIGDFRILEFLPDENRNAFPVPEWWEGKVHNRIPRGA